jgi:hypothetical protein
MRWTYRRTVGFTPRRSELLHLVDPRRAFEATEYVDLANHSQERQDELHDQTVERMQPLGGAKPRAIERMAALAARAVAAVADRRSGERLPPDESAGRSCAAASATRDR